MTFLRTADNVTNVMQAWFWRREYLDQCKRYEDAGGNRGWGNDLATELTLRDAEYARDEARKLYREYWAKARRASLSAAA